MQFLLYVLESVLVELILIGNLSIIFLHCLGYHLIVLVIRVDNDEGGPIGLELLHYLKAILKEMLVLSLGDFILKCFNGLLVFSTSINVLIFPGFNTSILSCPFILFGVEFLSYLGMSYIFYL